MKLVRAFLLALLLSLLFGLALGTWLRLQLERPPVYIGGSGLPTRPGQEVGPGPVRTTPRAEPGALG